MEYRKNVLTWFGGLVVDSFLTTQLTRRAKKMRLNLLRKSKEENKIKIIPMSKHNTQKVSFLRCQFLFVFRFVWYKSRIWFVKLQQTLPPSSAAINAPTQFHIFSVLHLNTRQSRWPAVRPSGWPSIYLFIHTVSQQGQIVAVLYIDHIVKVRPTSVLFE